MSKTYLEEGTTIKGNTIVCESRKISDVQVIVKTGRHKAQRVILKDNAMARIAKKYRFIK
jgi:hypothetical protein